MQRIDTMFLNCLEAALFEDQSRTWHPAVLASASADDIAFNHQMDRLNRALTINISDFDYREMPEGPVLDRNRWHVLACGRMAYDWNWQRFNQFGAAPYGTIPDSMPWAKSLAWTDKVIFYGGFVTMFPQDELLDCTTRVLSWPRP